MLCEPGLKLEITSVALPAEIEAGPRGVAPSKNSTVPLAGLVLIDAVNVTVDPAHAGFISETTETVCALSPALTRQRKTSETKPDLLTNNNARIKVSFKRVVWCGSQFSKMWSLSMDKMSYTSQIVPLSWSHTRIEF